MSNYAQKERNWLSIKFGIAFLLVVGICVFIIHYQPNGVLTKRDNLISEVMAFNEYKSREALIVNQMDTLLQAIGGLKTKEELERIPTRNEIAAAIDQIFVSEDNLSLQLMPRLNKLYKQYMDKVLEVDKCKQVCISIQKEIAKDSSDHVTIMSTKNTEYLNARLLQGSQR